MNLREEFRAALNAATIRAFALAQSELGSEELYSFGLYTSGEYRYVTTTVGTEVGLRKVAGRYLSEEKYKKKWGNMETASAHLRWSPCDSPHHEAFSEEFEEAGTHLTSLWEEVDEDSDEEYDALVEFVHGVMIAALHGLRADGLVKDQVVLNLLMGDQSDEERISTSEFLNPLETHLRFCKELEV